MGKIKGVNFWLVLIDCSPCSRNTTQEKGFLCELLKSAKNWIKVAENIIFTKNSGWSKIVLGPMLLASFWTKLLPTNHYLFKAKKKNILEIKLTIKNQMSRTLLWCLYCQPQTYFTSFNFSIINFEKIRACWVTQKTNCWDIFKFRLAICSNLASKKMWSSVTTFVSLHHF